MSAQICGEEKSSWLVLSIYTTHNILFRHHPSWVIWFFFRAPTLSKSTYSCNCYLILRRLHIYYCKPLSRPSWSKNHPKEKTTSPNYPNGQPNRIPTHLLCFRLFKNSISFRLRRSCSTPTIPEIGSVQMTQLMSHITSAFGTSEEHRGKVTWKSRSKCIVPYRMAGWNHSMLPSLSLSLSLQLHIYYIYIVKTTV